MSVVPSSVCPCHGMANITRPSLVRGIMMALSPAKKDRFTTNEYPGSVQSWGERSDRQPSNRIAKRTRSVDHGPRFYGELISCRQVPSRHGGSAQSNHLCIIKNSCAMIGCGLDQGKQQADIIMNCGRRNTRRRPVDLPSVSWVRPSKFRSG